MSAILEKKTCLISNLESFFFCVLSIIIIFDRITLTTEMSVRWPSWIYLSYDEMEFEYCF